MQFTTLTFAALCGCAMASQSLLFKNSADYDRLVHCTPALSGYKYPDFVIPAGSTQRIGPLPDVWAGTFAAQRLQKGSTTAILAADVYSNQKQYVSKFANNAANNDGMLAEITRDANNKPYAETSYDISAIVNAADTNNVMRIYPVTTGPGHSDAELGTAGCLIPSGSAFSTCAANTEIYGKPEDNGCVKSIRDSANQDLVIELGNAAAGAASGSTPAAATTSVAPVVASATSVTPVVASANPIVAAEVSAVTPVTNGAMIPVVGANGGIVTVVVTQTAWARPGATGAPHNHRRRAHARDISA